MKKFIVITLAALCLIGCSKNEGPARGGIKDTCWKSERWKGNHIFHICFTDESTFRFYDDYQGQSLLLGGYWPETGKYTVDSEGNITFQNFHASNVKISEGWDNIDRNKRSMMNEIVFTTGKWKNGIPNGTLDFTNGLIVQCDHTYYMSGTVKESNHYEIIFEWSKD